MSETRVAKLFKNGASQAVRLPAEFRLEGEEVYVTRDDTTGDIVPSKRPRRQSLERFLCTAAFNRRPSRLHGRAPNECCAESARRLG